MVQMFPVVRRRENKAAIIRIINIVHIIRHLEKSGTHQLKWKEGERAMHNNHIHAFTGNNGDEVLTGCFVPCACSQ